jgi:hypothetical protein
MKRDYLIPLRKALSLIPRQIDYSTLWHWTKGVKGVKLQSVMIGGRLFTKPSWVEEYLAACQDTHALLGEPDSEFIKRFDEVLESRAKDSEPSSARQETQSTSNSNSRTGRRRPKPQDKAGSKSADNSGQKRSKKRKREG